MHKQKFLPRMQANRLKQLARPIRVKSGRPYQSVAHRPASR
jgi:hypothetical protein